MTISNTTRKAGPFIGNGATTVFPFTFKVFDKTDIEALRVDGNGISTTLVLDSDYSVLLNADQDGSPGGQITYPITGTPLAAGYQLVMLGDLPYDQETDITNQGGFYPQVIEDMVDRATIQIQQLKEITSRAIVVSPSESLNPVLPTAQARAGTVLGFDSLGGVTLLPQPSTLGGGNMRTDVFRSANGDFVPGTTRAFTLSRDPGSADNVWASWDGAQQFDFVLTGTTLTFNDPVDVNVTVVRIRIGTVLSIFTPSAGSVGDAALQFGDLLPRCFTSIANLRATNDARYRVAFVTGYYAPHDGGGGPYVIDAADTTSVDNGGSIIVDAIGRRWKLNTPSGTNNVKQFGAIGNRVADDTSKINQAISDGKLVEVPPGAYLVNAAANNAAIVLDYSLAATSEPVGPSAHGMGLRGRNPRQSILFAGTPGMYALEVKGTADGSNAGCHIYDPLEKIAFAGVNGANGLHLFATAFGSIRDLVFSGLNTGMFLETTLSYQFSNLTFNSNVVGVTASRGAGFSNPNALLFESCRFAFSSSLGYSGNDPHANVSFVGGSFEANGTQGNAFTGGIALNFDGGSQGAVGANFDGVYFEGNRGASDITLTNTGSTYITVTIKGCNFNRVSGSNFVTNNIKVLGKVRLVLIGCTFNGFNDYVEDVSRLYVNATADAKVACIGCVFGSATAQGTLTNIDGA